MLEPTLLDVSDGVSRLRSQICFLDLALHSPQLQKALDGQAFDGLIMYLQDVNDLLAWVDRQLTVIRQGGVA